MEIGRLVGVKKFEGERENFIFSAFTDFKPANKFENGSGVSVFRGLDNNASKRVLNQL